MPKLVRQSPNESATLSDVGTIKRGNDGREWIIKSYNGVKRWTPFDSSIFKAASFLHGRINRIDLDLIINKLKVGKPKLLGTLNITSNKIGIGELLYHEYPAKKGQYDIYQYVNSLIAVHENSQISGQKFKLTKQTANCDAGMFSFNDAAWLKWYASNRDNKIKKIFGKKFPDFSTNVLIRSSRHQIDGTDAYYVYDSDINKKSSEEHDDDPVAIFAGNGFGDGSFPIFKGTNAYLIMSYDLEDKIFALFDK